MRFSQWHNFEQLDRIPTRSGLFQVRQITGLLSYPSGKSAMYMYGMAPSDLRQSLDKIFFELDKGVFLGRYSLDARSLDWSRELRRLLDDFAHRFGSEPLGNTVYGHGARIFGLDP